MSITAATTDDPGATRGIEDLLALYGEHCEELGIKAASRTQRLRAASSFLEHHGDPANWMRRGVDRRLADLSAMEGAWPFLTFLIASGRLRVDFELLARKHAGQTFSRSVATCHRAEIERLVGAARRLGWNEKWLNIVLNDALTLAVAYCGVSPSELTAESLDDLGTEIKATPHYSEPIRRLKRSHLHSLRRLLYEAAMIDRPAVRKRGDGPGNLASRLSMVVAPEIRKAMLSYLEARQAVLRPSSIRQLARYLAFFGEFLSEVFPELSSLSALERRHVEAFISYQSTRRCQGMGETERRISVGTVHGTLVSLRTFFEDLHAWGWKEAPKRTLLHATDIPRLPEHLPRALAPDVDQALMSAVEQLEDRFARVGITILRGAGLRIGELLALELECVTDYGEHGSWLKVPLGKLDNERSVPLDEVTLAAIDEWRAGRGTQRALPNERDGRLVDYLFVEHGYLLSPVRIQQGLRKAVRVAGLTGTDGHPLRVVPHQLRHTYATSLANAGMSMQGLMTLLGHRSPQMTLRYATLASPTLRRAYEQAIGKMRPRIPVAFANQPPMPDKVSWLASEMLKTRVAHGYCAREIVAEACPYANVCEQCAYFVTTPEFEPVLKRQLADVQTLRDDAIARGWESEAARHERVAGSLEGHLRRLKKSG